MEKYAKNYSVEFFQYRFNSKGFGRNVVLRQKQGWPRSATSGGIQGGYFQQIFSQPREDFSNSGG